MTALQTLRNTPWLARLALLWFALTLGVAVASPVVNPQSEVLICSAAGGMVKIVLNDDGTVSSTSAALDCPLCVLGHAAAPVAVVAPEPVQPLGHVLQSIPAARLAAATAAPPPSRGPPAFL
ncbi:DUF2946 family protein [Rhodoferax sp.]|uniref:DUF2946 family protein n=1 Tax=Rhodoferax sp. TaxID=50421 RepID=UPI00261AB1D8|nr:DUF2946 family protein [Rhodoferax sp.]MDD2925994.1 hypothetical protein [Rhodoferax sp.]